MESGARSAFAPSTHQCGSGLAGYSFESKRGLLAHAKKPKAEAEQINAAVNKVLAMDLVQQRVATLGVLSDAMTTAEFGKVFVDDQDLMAKVVKSSRPKAE